MHDFREKPLRTCCVNHFITADPERLFVSKERNEKENKQKVHQTLFQNLTHLTIKKREYL